MKKPMIAAVVALASLSACGKHVPTDAELTTLLQSTALSKNTDASHPLDAIAVQCLSVHSGDATLLGQLPEAARSDNAKSQCRARLDLWLADAKRNPGKFKFEEISTPAVARQAMRLYLANGGIPFTQAREEPQQAPPPAPMPQTTPEAPAPDIDNALFQADNACKDVKAAVARGPFNPRLQRYSEICERDVIATRETIARLRQQGRQAEIDEQARRLEKMRESAQTILGRPSGT